MDPDPALDPGPSIIQVNDENCRIRIQDPNPDPNPDPLVRGMDPQIRIYPKMSWIRNIAQNTLLCKQNG
jgi:hypothetical protein